jgi:hypothetical protein
MIKSLREIKVAKNCSYRLIIILLLLGLHQLVIAEEKYTHFELGKGEKIKVIEPYNSFWDIIVDQPSSSDNISGSNLNKITPLDFLRPAEVVANRLSTKTNADLVNNILKKVDSKNSLMSEFLETATEFFKSQESRAPITPPSVKHMVAAGSEVVIDEAATIATEYYSEELKAKLIGVYKQIFEKHQIDFENGSVEKVRQELLEKTLDTLNEYMASYYDPDEFAFKGLIIGAHVKGDLLKYMDSLAKKILPPLVMDYGRLTGSSGFILHSPKKVTTVSSLNSKEILDEHTVFTMTPALWLSARLKKSFESNAVESTTAKDAPMLQNASTESHYWTAGCIMAKKDVDVSTMENLAGFFGEISFVVMGFTININRAFFLRDRTPAAYATSVSIAHNGLIKSQRRQISKALGNFKVIANVGYLNVIPVKDYSMDISVP